MNAHKHLTRNQQGAQAVAAGAAAHGVWRGGGGKRWAAFCGNNYKRRTRLAAAKQMIALSRSTLSRITLSDSTPPPSPGTWTFISLKRTNRRRRRRRRAASLFDPGILLFRFKGHYYVNNRQL